MASTVLPGDARPPLDLGPAVPVMVTLDDGVRVFVDPADPAVGVPISKGCFELNELDFVRRTVRAGWHVVDGGAHAGLYALTMAAIVGPSGRVDAFEPVGSSAGCLALGVRANHFETIVHIERVALSNATGRGEMVLANEGHSSTAYVRQGSQAVPQGFHARPVPTIALDDHLAGRRVDFVRLDVEGAEGLVLRGSERALAARHPLVLAELHSLLLPAVSGMTAADLILWMRGLGYRCRLLGAGVPGEEIDDTPSNGVRAVVFLP